MYKGDVLPGLLWLGATAVGYFVLIVPGVILHLAAVIQASQGDPAKPGGEKALVHRPRAESHEEPLGFLAAGTVAVAIAFFLLKLLEGL